MTHLDERTARETLVYEALRFANWAAGEGICPVEGEPSTAPEDFLMAYTNATDDVDWESLPYRISGFRILGPDEIDGPTVERCAEVADAVVKDHQGPFTSQPAYVAACTIRDALRALKEKRT